MTGHATPTPAWRRWTATALIGTLGLLGIAVGAPLAHATSTLYVHPTNTASAGGSCASPNSNSIQGAITAAGEGDTVHVCAGTYEIGSTLTVSKSLTLQGEGGLSTVLDGGDARRILAIDSDARIDVVVADLTFRRGFTPVVGGDPFESGGAAIAVDLQNASLTVRGSTFYANTSSHSGGAIYATRVAGIDDSQALSVYGSTFVGNRAGSGTTYYGGGIAVIGSMAYHVIENSTFVNNWAARSGGAVYFVFSDHAVISYSTFLDNSVTYSSGRSAIEFGALATLKGSVVADTNPGIAQCGGQVPTSIAVLATGSGCGGTATTYGDVHLGPLGNFGGPTQTVLVKADSSVLTIAGTGCPATDQRGATRGTPCTIGATEYAAGAPALEPLNQVVVGRAGSQITASTAYTPSGFSGAVTYELAPALPRLDSLPSGLSFSPASGVISGTPAAAYDDGCTLDALVPCRYFLITARDVGGHAASALLRLTVLAVDSPVSFQTITVTASAPRQSEPGSTFDVSATSSSGLSVGISTFGACTGRGKGSATITMSAERGTCSVVYEQPGNRTNAPATTVIEKVSSVQEVVAGPVSTPPTTEVSTPQEPARGVGAHTGDTDGSPLLITLGLWGLLSAGALLLRGVTPGQWRAAVLAVPLLLGVIAVRALVAAWDFRVTWVAGGRDD